MPITFYKYLARQFFVWVVYVVAIFFVIVFLVDFMELLRRASDQNIDLRVLLRMAFLKAPSMAGKLLPFSVLFASMMTLWRMIRNQELVVVRAAGISIWQVLLPLIILGLLLGTFRAFVFNPFEAATLSRFEHLEARYLKGKGSFMAVSPSGLWLRQSLEENYAIIYAQQISTDGSHLTLPSVFIYDNKDSFISRIDAGRAVLMQGKWRLENVRISKVDHPILNQKEYVLETDLTPEKIQDSFAPPETISFWNLKDFIHTLESSGFSSARHRLHYHVLLSTPLLLCAMILVAMAFTVHIRSRHAKVFYAFVGCIFASFLLHIMSDVIMAMGLVGRLPVSVSAWVPGVVVSLLGMAAILHLEDG